MKEGVDSKARAIPRKKGSGSVFGMDKYSYLYKKRISYTINEVIDSSPKGPPGSKIELLFFYENFRKL